MKTTKKTIISQAKRPSGPPDRVSAVRWYERTANPWWIHGTSPVYLPTWKNIKSSKCRYNYIPVPWILWERKGCSVFSTWKMTHRHHQIFVYMKGKGVVEKTLEKKHMPREWRYVLRSGSWTFLSTKNAWDFWKLGKSSRSLFGKFLAGKSWSDHLPQSPSHCSFDKKSHYHWQSNNGNHVLAKQFKQNGNFPGRLEICEPPNLAEHCDGLFWEGKMGTQMDGYQT